MRRMPAVALFTISLLCQAVPAARATPERPVEQQGRRLDFDNRVLQRCSHAPHLLRTAYIPGETPPGGRVSLRSCLSDKDQIGAGYTQFVRNSAVRQRHHRVRG